MAKPELGAKRQCQSCGAKFYDLNKEPIVCPKCGATYTAAAIAAPVRGRAAEVANRDEDEDTEEAGAGPELVSLDEVEADEASKELPSDDDVEIEDDIAEDDDTFLEEEESGDDDVSDLIDSEIEDDEEA